MPMHCLIDLVDGYITVHLQYHGSYNNAILYLHNNKSSSVIDDDDHSDI